MFGMRGRFSCDRIYGKAATMVAVKKFARPKGVNRLETENIDFLSWP